MRGYYACEMLTPVISAWLVFSDEAVNDKHTIAFFAPILNFHHVAFYFFAIYFGSRFMSLN